VVRLQSTHAGKDEKVVQLNEHDDTSRPRLHPSLTGPFQLYRV
jgi:hypothetical protein